MAPVTTSQSRIRPVALPNEHGGWALLLEPAIAGLVAAPTAAGGLLSLAALGAFLARHPLTLALGDRRRGRRYPRTALAERFAAGYGLLALAALALAILTTPAPFWPAILAAAPLALVQVAYDLRRQGRTLPAELAGTLALAALAPATLLAAGRGAAEAMTIWALLACQAAPAIVYIRCRLRRSRGEAADVRPAILAHLAALLCAAGLLAAGLTAWPVVVSVAILLLRATYGLLIARSTPAVQVGIEELALGVAFALIVGAYAR